MATRSLLAVILFFAYRVHGSDELPVTKLSANLLTRTEPVGFLDQMPRGIENQCVPASQDRFRREGQQAAVYLLPTGAAAEYHCLSSSCQSAVEAVQMRVPAEQQPRNGMVNL